MAAASLGLAAGPIQPALLANNQFMHPERAARDANRVLQTYNFGYALRQNPAEMRVQLCLEGQLPYFYGQATYHVSTRIWVPLQYPALPPTLMVFASPGTTLNPNPHLDKLGKFYHPYLNQWSNNAQTSTLIELLNIAITEFGRIAPVIAAPAARASPQQPPMQHVPPLAQPVVHSFPSNNGSGSPRQSWSPASAQQQSEDSQLEEVRRTSLLSAVTERLDRDHAALQEEVTYLLQDQARLQDNQSRLEAEIRRLEGEQDAILTNKERLRELTADISGKLQRLRATPELSVEEITTSAPLYNQLYTLVAEEQAMEDALYVLSKAFYRGRIDLQVYMKMVRLMSRDQFLKKALINKIVEHANIPA